LQTQNAHLKYQKLVSRKIKSFGKKVVKGLLNWIMKLLLKRTSGKKGVLQFAFNEIYEPTKISIPISTNDNHTHI
jgi:hypothetical protein